MLRRCAIAVCKTLAAILFIVCSTDSATAQSGSFIPFADDSLALDKLLKATTLHFESDKAATTGENKKYIIEKYQERYDQLKKMYTNKEFVTNPQAVAYLNALLQSIISKNPPLQPLKPTVLFSKVYWPNAASFGEGTLVFNISLFNRLQTEAQAAFVLCHELAHLYLDHTNKSISQYVATMFSKETQSELRNIKKSEYGRGQRLNTLTKSFAFGSRRHSRGHESEADSVGLLFLKNTGYDVRASLQVLALLDSVDKEKYNQQLHLSEQLNFPDYPFQNRWVRAKSVSLGEAVAAANGGLEEEEAEKDSLKTHPGCPARIKALQPSVAADYNPTQKDFLIDKVYFDTLVARFDEERIAYCYGQNQVSRALYYSLQLFRLHPDDAWLAAMVGKCYNALYTAQQQHYLGHYVDLPTSSKERSEYDMFLQYLQSLRLDEMAAEGYWFMNGQQNHFATSEAFIKEYKISQKNYTDVSKK